MYCNTNLKKKEITCSTENLCRFTSMRLRDKIYANRINLREVRYPRFVEYRKSVNSTVRVCAFV